MRPAGRLLGRHTVWGKEGVLPPASGSSSQRSYYVYGSVQTTRDVESSSFALTCLRSPPSHNPHPRFHIELLSCRFRYESFVLQPNVGARPLALDAPSGNSPTALFVCACPTRAFTGSRARTNPAR